MEHTELLDKLGGPHAVHAELVQRGVVITPVAVRAWALTDRAIPAKYWAMIKEIADQKRVKVTFAELAESVRATPTPRPESAAA